MGVIASSDVVAGGPPLASQYNNLRADVITNHNHDTGKGGPVMILMSGTNADRGNTTPSVGSVWIVTDAGQENRGIYVCFSGTTWTKISDHDQLAGITANDHHAQAHAVDGADHTLGSITTGKIVVAGASALTGLTAGHNGTLNADLVDGYHCYDLVEPLRLPDTAGVQSGAGVWVPQSGSYFLFNGRGYTYKLVANMTCALEGSDPRAYSIRLKNVTTGLDYGTIATSSTTSELKQSDNFVLPAAASGLDTFQIEEMCAANVAGGVSINGYLVCVD